MSVRVYFDPEKIHIEGTGAGSRVCLRDDDGNVFSASLDNGVPYLEFLGDRRVILAPQLLSAIQLVTVYDSTSDRGLVGVLKSGDHELGSAVARVRFEDIYSHGSRILFADIKVSAPTLTEAIDLYTKVLRGKAPDFPFERSVSPVRRFFERLWGSLLS